MKLVVKITPIKKDDLDAIYKKLVEALIDYRDEEYTLLCVHGERIHLTYNDNVSTMCDFMRVKLPACIIGCSSFTVGYPTEAEREEKGVDGTEASGLLEVGRDTRETHLVGGEGAGELMGDTEERDPLASPPLGAAGLGDDLPAFFSYVFLPLIGGEFPLELLHLMEMGEHHRLQQHSYKEMDYFVLNCTKDNFEVMGRLLKQAGVLVRQRRLGTVRSLDDMGVPEDMLVELLERRVVRSASAFSPAIGARPLARRPIPVMATPLTSAAELPEAAGMFGLGR